MSDNDKFLSEQGIQDDIDHDIDPFLAYIVTAVNDQEMPEQDLWLCLSGIFVTGRLGTSKDGFFCVHGGERGVSSP